MTDKHELYGKINNDGDGINLIVGKHKSYCPAGKILSKIVSDMKSKTEEINVVNNHLETIGAIHDKNLIDVDFEGLSGIKDMKWTNKNKFSRVYNALCEKYKQVCDTHTKCMDHANYVTRSFNQNIHMGGAGEIRLDNALESIDKLSQLVELYMGKSNREFVKDTVSADIDKVKEEVTYVIPRVSHTFLDNVKKNNKMHMDKISEDDMKRFFESDETQNVQFDEENTDKSSYYEYNGDAATNKYTELINEVDMLIRQNIMVNNDITEKFYEKIKIFINDGVANTTPTNHILLGDIFKFLHEGDLFKSIYELEEKLTGSGSLNDLNKIFTILLDPIITISDTKEYVDHVFRLIAQGNILGICEKAKPPIVSFYDKYIGLVAEGILNQGTFNKLFVKCETIIKIHTHATTLPNPSYIEYLKLHKNKFVKNPDKTYGLIHDVLHDGKYAEYCNNLSNYITSLESTFIENVHTSQVGGVLTLTQMNKLVDAQLDDVNQLFENIQRVSHLHNKFSAKQSEYSDFKKINKLDEYIEIIKLHIQYVKSIQQIFEQCKNREYLDGIVDKRIKNFLCDVIFNEHNVLPINLLETLDENGCSDRFTNLMIEIYKSRGSVISVDFGSWCVCMYTYHMSRMAY
jgi:hypothetical protein